MDGCGDCVNCVQALIDNEYLGLGVYLPCERLCSDLPAHFLDSSVPRIEARNLPSPPALEEDSEDEAGLPVLSPILSQARPFSSSPVGRDLLGEGGRSAERRRSEEELKEAGDDGGGDSGSDMYVDEELTNMKEEEPEDRPLEYTSEATSKDREDQELPRNQAQVRVKCEAGDHDAVPYERPSEQQEPGGDDDDVVDSDLLTRPGRRLQHSTPPLPPSTMPLPPSTIPPNASQKRKLSVDVEDRATGDGRLKTLRFKKRKIIPSPVPCPAGGISGPPPAPTPTRPASSSSRTLFPTSKFADAKVEAPKTSAGRERSTARSVPAPSSVPKSKSKLTAKPVVPVPSSGSRKPNPVLGASRPSSRPRLSPTPVKMKTKAKTKPKSTESSTKPTPTESYTQLKPTESYTKHPVHWHLDGSLLVQLGGVRYRLHRSRMVGVSGVLRDVLEEGGVGGWRDEKGKGKGKGKAKQKESAKGEGKGKMEQKEGRRKGPCVEYEEDGTPLVRLDGVGIAREDWEGFLDAMDGVVTFIYNPPPLPHIASLLRASHLLRIPSFEAYAKKVFEDVWSGELESIGGTGSRSVSGKGCVGMGKGDIRAQGVSATEAVLLGRMCGLEGVVKRGMYELVKCEMFEQGGEGSDGEDSETAGERAPRLTQKEYMKLTSARSKLLSRWMRETAQFPEEVLPCAAFAARSRGSSPNAKRRGRSRGRDGDEGDGDVDGGVGEGVGRGGNEKEGEWGGCTGSDPLAAREAHRKLVIQSGVQEAHVNDVVGGLGVLVTLNWGHNPQGGESLRGVGFTASGERERGVGPRRSGGARDEGEGVVYGGFCEDCVRRLERVWGGARERVWRDCEVLFGV